MVSQIINVIVNSKGAVTVTKELNAMGDSAKKTTTYLNGLRAVLAAALTFSGANQIIETVDNFIVLQNRLKQVADSADDVGESWQRLMGIANDSYATIDNTVNLYFRVAQAYRAWGESAESAYEFTDLFQKAAVLSGSSMQTTSQAVYQFSQALNKGKLDGDEFRSVLEGLPYVASLIQKSLGVTRAELYEMSKDGKISVDRIKQAFEDAAAVIRGDWANITPTIGMAIVVLQNNWTDFLGSVQTSTGVFSALAYLILAVANNFTLLAVAMTPVVISLGFLAGRLGLGLVVLGLRDLTTALRTATATAWLFNAALYANPITIAIGAIVAIVAAVVYFRNELGLTNEVLAALWASAVTTFTGIMAYLTPLYTAVASVVKSFLEWSLVFVAIRKIASITKDDLVGLFNSVTSSVKGFVTYMKTALAPLFASLIALGKEYYAIIMEIAGLFSDLLNPVIEMMGAIFGTAWKLIKPMLKEFVLFLKDIWEGWKIIAAYITQNFMPTIKDAFEGWIIIIKTVVDWINNIISALRTAIALLRQMAGLGGGGGGGGAHNGAQFKAGEGFATGGAFKVGGTGSGRDTTPVAFRAERGERVTVETKKQQRDNDNQMSAANVNVPVTLINVLDPNMIPTAMQSEAGTRVIMNVFDANRDEILARLGVI